jgi:hypothetical protein
MIWGNSNILYFIYAKKYIQTKAEFAKPKKKFTLSKTSFFFKQEWIKIKYFNI